MRKETMMLIFDDFEIDSLSLPYRWSSPPVMQFRLAGILPVSVNPFTSAINPKSYRIHSIGSCYNILTNLILS
jgi:hypothetical protein